MSEFNIHHALRADIQKWIDIIHNELVEDIDHSTLTTLNSYTAELSSLRDKIDNRLRMEKIRREHLDSSE